MSSGTGEMRIKNRHGEYEPLAIDRITARLNMLARMHPALDVRASRITLATESKDGCSVLERLTDGISTSEIDEIAAVVALELAWRVFNLDYERLGNRIYVSNYQKNTSSSFVDTVRRLSVNRDDNGELAPLVTPEVLAFVNKHGEVLDKMLDYTRDWQCDFFALSTLKRGYLLPGERKQHFHMRHAVGLCAPDLDMIKQCYEYTSQGFFTFASPILFHAGTPCGGFTSCFLLPMQADSIEGIYDTLKQCAQISKMAGGIGVSISNIRADGAYIHGTNGRANGLAAMLPVFNATSRYVDQGGGKRKGAMAAYLEVWHADIQAVLDLKEQTGPPESRARDMHFALWVSDLFMERVESGGTWSLFSPHTCPDLQDSVGDAFKDKYERYEKMPSKVVRTVEARKLWEAIIERQLKSSEPFILFKDTCNLRSNHQHLGTIRSSNLCTEIIQYSSPTEIACCNLASIALPKFVGDGGKTFNFAELEKCTRFVVRALNNVIDRSPYPLEEMRRSNIRHRPMGIGVQGLADVFMMMDMEYGDEDSRKLNICIFETMYYAAVTESCRIAQEKGSAYPSFRGSPMSRGILQFDYWLKDEASGLSTWLPNHVYGTHARYNWRAVKEDVVKHGVYNSLLIALMPTASTSQILGNSESFEPRTSNVFMRRTHAGDFRCVNQYLVRCLQQMGLWTLAMRNRIVANGGSVQRIPDIPERVRKVFKTAGELKFITMIKMSAERSPFIDQSQSFSVQVNDPNYAKLSSLHFQAWRHKLKTGMYYLRQTGVVEGVNMAPSATATPSSSSIPAAASTGPTGDTGPASAIACTRRDREEGRCISCGS